MVRNAFMRMDVDGSGRLDLIELSMEMYKARMRLLPPQSRGTISDQEQAEHKEEGRRDAEGLLAKYDRNLSGSLDWHEFLAATCDPEWSSLLPSEVTGQDVAALFKAEAGGKEDTAENAAEAASQATSRNIPGGGGGGGAPNHGEAVWEKHTGKRGLLERHTGVDGKAISGLLQEEGGRTWCSAEGTHHLEILSKATPALPVWGPRRRVPCYGVPVEVAS